VTRMLLSNAAEHKRSQFRLQRNFQVLPDCGV